MSVFLTIPSKKPRAEAEAVLAKWREMGYLLAIWRDEGDEPVDCEILLTGKYPGYAVACNRLIAAAREYSEDAQWFVCAGDDILPDANHRADEIAESCDRHFSPEVLPHWKKHTMPGTTFGVMQPTGDRWGEDPRLPNLHPMRTAYIDRVAGSAWYGREYCERMYDGKGPLFEGYQHMFVDEEVWHVAKMMAVYWERRDLTQEHRHWARERRQMPQYLREVNSPEHWGRYRKLFEQRKAAGFPGARPSEVANCA